MARGKGQETSRRRYEGRETHKNADAGSNCHPAKRTGTADYPRQGGQVGGGCWVLMEAKPTAQCRGPGLVSDGSKAGARLIKQVRNLFTGGTREGMTTGTRTDQPNQTNRGRKARNQGGLSATIETIPTRGKSDRNVRRKGTRPSPYLRRMRSKTTAERRSRRLAGSRR